MIGAGLLTPPKPTTEGLLLNFMKTRLWQNDVGQNDEESRIKILYRSALHRSAQLNLIWPCSARVSPLFGAGLLTSPDPAETDDQRSPLFFTQRLGSRTYAKCQASHCERLTSRRSVKATFPAGLF